jgi:hypothetical protein
MELLFQVTKGAITGFSVQQPAVSGQHHPVVRSGRHEPYWNCPVSRIGGTYPRPAETRSNRQGLEQLVELELNLISPSSSLHLQRVAIEPWGSIVRTFRKSGNGKLKADRWGLLVGIMSGSSGGPPEPRAGFFARSVLAPTSSCPIEQV